MAEPKASGISETGVYANVRGTVQALLAGGVNPQGLPSAGVDPAVIRAAVLDAFEAAGVKWEAS